MASNPGPSAPSFTRPRFWCVVLASALAGCGSQSPPLGAEPKPDAGATGQRDTRIEAPEADAARPSGDAAAGENDTGGLSFDAGRSDGPGGSDAITARDATAAGDLPPPPPLRPGGAWVEKDGVVSMEAERGKGTWAIVEDRALSSGRFIRDPGSGSMTFTFTTSKPGKWYVFLLALRGFETPRNDDENDCFVEVDGQKLWGSDDMLRPDGMRVHGTTWNWTWRPKGPGAHNEGPTREGNVYAKIDRAGSHQIVLRHRSKNFTVDKIVLKHESVLEPLAAPIGFGPPETE